MSMCLTSAAKVCNPNGGPRMRPDSTASTGSPGGRRYAVVGTGARAEMFVRALTTTHADRARLVALCDPNPLRIAAHQRWLGAAGHPAVAEYPAGRVAEMLAAEDVDTLVVTSVDR